MNKYIVIFLLAIFSCQSSSENKSQTESADVKKEWISLFNGKDLTGWTPKFAKSAYGVNYKNTFRVEDGKIKVSYEEYDSFDGEFGHLFYQDSMSDYHLRVEYRFLGEQTPGGPGWAYKNSGVMYHCQRPETMEIKQDFPICLEGQFLGGNGMDPRSTGNLCTPATHVTIEGELVTDHCISSSSKTIGDTSWVMAEFIVHGSKEAFHLIDGDTVFHYTDPIYGGKGALEKKYESWDGLSVEGGWIALQAESHPVEFRRVEVQQLGNQ